MDLRTKIYDDLEKLQTPAFCVDKAILAANCSRMIANAEKLGVELRPHMKTHKTIEAGVLMTGGTKRKIVVSTLAEAEFYADAGFDDIVYAYPLTSEKIPRCALLANRLTAFHVLTDNKITLAALAQCKENNKPWSVFLKVDCGNNRSGVFWQDTHIGVELINKMKNDNNLTFAGLYVHCGDSYKAGTENKSAGVQMVIKNTTERLHEFAKELEKQTGVQCKRLGIGSTPSCSLPSDDMKNLTEIHPGNYVFYDAQQYTLGSCTKGEIACTVATRIIGHYPRRNQLLIDCGFSALTKQGMDQLPGGFVIFKNEENLKLIDMTQEIGKVTSADGGPLDYETYPIGSMLFMYPYHSCATAAMHPKYYIIEKEKIVDIWYPCRGW